MKFHIRGSLGAQILSIVSAYAIAINKNKSITDFIINSGNYKKRIEELYPELHEDIRYFESVIDFKSKPNITVQNGTSKTICDIPVAKLICQHIQKIRNELSISYTKQYTVQNNAVHIRYLEDRRLCTIDTYAKLLEHVRDPIIFSDSLDIVKSHFNSYKYSEQNDIICDWLSLTKSNNIYATPSSFSWTPGFLNEDINIHILPKHLCEHHSQFPQWDIIDCFVKQLPNFHYYDFHK